MTIPAVSKTTSTSGHRWLRDELRFQPVRQPGDGIMSTPDDYRAMAEECFRWARQAQTEDKRQAYLDVARPLRVWTAALPLRRQPSGPSIRSIDPTKRLKGFSGQTSDQRPSPGVVQTARDAWPSGAIGGAIEPSMRSLFIVGQICTNPLRHYHDECAVIHVHPIVASHKLIRGVSNE